jgi:HipA-like C-terminal domain
LSGDNHYFPSGNYDCRPSREIIARNLGISARNDYAMLEQIGGECAGAVTFIPAGEGLPERNYSYRALSSEELAAILKELPKRPLLAGEEGIRLSLAGAQDKVAVRIEGAEISLPLGGAPSTHILKPAVAHFEGVVFNEALCMKLAAAAGLPAASVETRTVDGMEYLLVERYDRTHRHVAVRIPVKWSGDSGDVGQHRSEATLGCSYISEVNHLSQESGQVGCNHHHFVSWSPESHEAAFR